MPVIETHRVISYEEPFQVLSPPLEHQVVEHLDPVLLGFVQWLFSEGSGCEPLKFLAHLGRRATIKQGSIYGYGTTGYYAACHIRGAAELCKDPSWPLGYHATQRYFILFEALTILHRARIHQETEVFIPLGKRDLNKEAILANLKKKEQKHKDIKTRQLLGRVRRQIEQFGIATNTFDIDTALPPPLMTKLASLIEEIASRLSEMKLPTKKRAILTQWIAHEVLECVQSVTVKESPFSQTGDSHYEEKTFNNTQITLERREKEGREESCSPLLEERALPTSLQEPIAPAPISSSARENEHANPLESPVSKENQVKREKLGDSELYSSKSNHISLNLITESNTNFDIGEITSTTIAQSGERQISEEELEKLTVQYMAVLDDPAFANPEYLKLFLQESDGLKHYRSIKKSIRTNPYYARASAISALLRRHFPRYFSRSGQRLESMGAWFNSSFQGYTKRKDPLTPKPMVNFWTKSSYSLEEIVTFFRYWELRSLGGEVPFPESNEVKAFFWSHVEEGMAPTTQINDLRLCASETLEQQARHDINGDMVRRTGEASTGSNMDEFNQASQITGQHVPEVVHEPEVTNGESRTSLEEVWQRTGYDIATIQWMLDCSFAAEPDRGGGYPYPDEIVLSVEHLPHAPFPDVWAYLHESGYLFVEVEEHVYTLAEYRDLYARTIDADMEYNDAGSLAVQETFWQEEFPWFVQRGWVNPDPGDVPLPPAFLGHLDAFRTRLAQVSPAFLVEAVCPTPGKYVMRVRELSTERTWILSSPQQARQFVGEVRTLRRAKSLIVLLGEQCNPQVRQGLVRQLVALPDLQRITQMVGNAISLADLASLFCATDMFKQEAITWFFAFLAKTDTHGALQVLERWFSEDGGSGFPEGKAFDMLVRTLTYLIKAMEDPDLVARAGRLLVRMADGENEEMATVPEL